MKWEYHRIVAGIGRGPCLSLYRYYKQGGIVLRITTEPGIVGVITSTMSRYQEFHMTLGTVKMPFGSVMTWEMGLDIAFNLNNLCRKLLENKKMQWLWILGDDHLFLPDVLTRLLAKCKDIVVPLCAKRTHPFHPVIYTRKESKYYQINWESLKNRTGLIEVDGVGNAGMLIRRNVIEKLGDDWHRMGWQIPEHGGSDLYFCKRATEEGFQLYVDLDNHIGHIAHMGVWPVTTVNGLRKNRVYNAEIREALNIPDAKNK